MQTLHPGIPVSCSSLAEPGNTLTGIADIALRDPSGRLLGSKLPPVTLVMVADHGAFLYFRRDNTVLSRTLLHGPLATPDPVRAQRTRATFAHADREGTIQCDLDPATNGEPFFVDLAGPERGPYARPLVGEYERPMPPHGSGTLPEGNPGNYGVMYNLRITLTNRFPMPVKVSCILNAAGGPGGSALGLKEGYCSPRVFLNSFESWIWRDIVLAPGESRTEPLLFSLPGGANGAHRLYFWPQAVNS